MSTDQTSDAVPAGMVGSAFASLFQAVAGLRNRRAIAALLGCMFVGILVAGLLLAMAGTLGFLAGLLASLVWLLAIGTGVNGAGLLQMDHARGISPRSLADALVHGLMCIPKLIVLGLALIAVEVAVFVVIALLLVICKIPFLGPLLFVVVFPLSVVVAGITVTGLVLCMVLSLPAIWQGASITRALAQTFTIVKSRLVETVLLLVLLGFICFAVGLIVFGVLMSGLVPTLGLSLSIVGFGGFGMESMLAMAQGYGSGGHAVAGAVGGALLWAVAGSLVGQVYLLGLSLVYLRVTEGLDLSASEAALRASFDDARRRTAEFGAKARQATQRDASAAAAAGGVAAAATGTPSPGFGAPPAFAAATPPALDRSVERGASDPLASSASGDDQATVASLPSVEPAPIVGTDIDLPLDVESPSAWAPPPAAVPPMAGLPAAAPLPAISTCPQCLSPVTPEDGFCGVCGYRLK